MRILEELLGAVDAEEGGDFFDIRVFDIALDFLDGDGVAEAGIAGNSIQGGLRFSDLLVRNFWNELSGQHLGGEHGLPADQALLLLELLKQASILS